ncbi:hypothetical protein PUW24_01610 [Paenibacillus urinalis]|uniref:ABC transporter permease n=1 Tax=Paenibacillus urinalis TaxID=521520 RepID=A0AAX3MX24_9BACL|nr:MULTISPECIES: hypothetical protein [Paenibacillus]WDH81676.1 hypothetical protein PUW23_19485 [Paenibacillus urinalis]WDH97721.1 hypothetical protein PUW24_01610 [Paenibacillus urinalis]WDI01396.1 hypothetical protein PUW25_19340 [Paenibacillus urinalis]GAK42180.1 hypothetical protein TCA2_4672 [Paenibacillus sp. TCA20]
MLRTLNTILHLQVSSIANRLIYYVRRLPLIGGLVSDNVYSRVGVKKAVAIAALLLSIVWGFLTSMLYVGLVVYFPVVTLGQELPIERQLDIFWHIFFIITFIIAGVSNARILEPKRSKYISVKLLRLPATRYMRATLSYKYVTLFVYLLTAVLLFSSLLGAPMLQGILLTAAAVMWRIVWEYFHYWLFRRSGSILIKNNVIVWTVIFIGYIAAYAPLLFEWALAWGAMLTSAVPLYVICILLGGIASVVLFWRLDYTDAVDAATKRDDPLLDLGRMMADAQQTAVKAKDSDYDLEGTNDSRRTFEKKEGYDYINAIFFSRHKSLIRRPLYKRLAIVAALGTALILAGFLYREPMAAAASSIGTFFPGLILIMAYLTVGEQLCKVLFFHCDLKLLRQSFYRQDAPKHFRIRLSRILGMNLLLAAVLALVLTLAAVAAGGLTTAIDYVFLWVSTLSLAVFFSVHHLFLYYIFQPYTTELNTKNPFFYLFSWIVSGVFVLSISLRPDPVVFSICTAVIALLYLVAALPLVRKYAPRTFRVK